MHITFTDDPGRVIGHILILSPVAALPIFRIGPENNRQLRSILDEDTVIFPVGSADSHSSSLCEEEYAAAAGVAKRLMEALILRSLVTVGVFGSRLFILFDLREYTCPFPFR